MKKVKDRVVNAATILLLTTLTIACKQEESMTQKEIVLGKLTSSEWILDKLSVDEVEQSLLDGMTITFTKTAYSTTGGEPVWPSGDSWSFIDEEASQMERGDGVVIALTEITDTKLVLSLNWDKTTFEEGRLVSIAGEHVFEFSH